jgi:hypothetical protein
MLAVSGARREALEAWDVILKIILRGRLGMRRFGRCVIGTPRLPAAARVSMLRGMFVVTEADAAAIRAVFDHEGELSAAIELRRRFPGITDNAKARACARNIAGWTPLPDPTRPSEHC